MVLACCLTQVFRMTGPGPCPPPANQACSGGSGGFPPGSKEKEASPFLPRSPPFVSRSLFLSLSFPPSAALSLAPVLAGPPYPTGGPFLPDRRALLTLTRQADTPYPTGGYSVTPLTTPVCTRASSVARRPSSGRCTCADGGTGTAQMTGLQPRAHRASSRELQAPGIH